MNDIFCNILPKKKMCRSEFFSIISNQDKDIRDREEKLRELQSDYMQSVQTLEDLKASVAPLKGMGFDIDSIGKVPLGAATDWDEFMRAREK